MRTFAETNIARGLRRARIADETIALAVFSALSFSAIDIGYTARGDIRPIYLADAIAELALASFVLVAD